MESPVPRRVARRVWEGGCRLRASRKGGLRAVPLPHISTTSCWPFPILPFQSCSKPMKARWLTTLIGCGSEKRNGGMGTPRPQQDYLPHRLSPRACDDPEACGHCAQLLPLVHSTAPSPRHSQSRARRHSWSRAWPGPCSRLGPLDPRRAPVEDHLDTYPDELLDERSDHCPVSA